MIDALPALGHGTLAAPAGSQSTAVAAGLLAFVLSLLVWPVVGFAIVVAHEGGHALTASMVGGKVQAIRVFARRRGETIHAGAGPVGRFFTTLAGYLGPPAFGLLGALLLHAGQSMAVLWISLVFLVLALIQMGNLLGAVAAIGTGAVMFSIIRYGSADARTFFAYVWTWFLLFGGVGSVIVTGWQNGDATSLRKRTFVPAFLWTAVFGTAAIAALIYGGGILLDMVHPHVHLAR